jgi:hypothetical protein
MSSFADFLEDELLDHAFGVASWTSPTNVYLALFTVAPTDTGGGTEVTGSGYARPICAFDVSSGGATANSALETFTASGGNYGDVVAIGIFDAITTGNMLAWDGITSATVNDGDTLEFAIGAIDITLT